MRAHPSPYNLGDLHGIFFEPIFGNRIPLMTYTYHNPRYIYVFTSVFSEIYHVSPLPWFITCVISLNWSEIFFRITKSRFMNLSFCRTLDWCRFIIILRKYEHHARWSHNPCTRFLQTRNRISEICGEIYIIWIKIYHDLIHCIFWKNITLLADAPPLFWFVSIFEDDRVDLITDSLDFILEKTFRAIL